MSNYDPNQPGQPYNPDSAGQNQHPNPYGENPYAQQPSPYGQNPYGQSPVAPGFNEYPNQGGYAAVQPPAERPKTLQIAFLLILLSGIVGAIASWMISTSNMFGNMVSSQWALVEQELQNQMQSTPEMAQDPTLQQMMSSPEAFISQANTMMTSFALVGAVISVILYFLVGFFVGRGIGAMRIIATILAVLSLLGLFSTVPMISMFADTQAGALNAVYVIGVLLGVAGVVFSWLRPSSDYIAQRRMARRAGYR
ncbi:hypothetical protein OF385_11765 [Glutamicibacter sp. JL.03c]|uniref:hypothetical protein n=1 Tax=Glutamicibacter sp. JL.03c TaxID=2984842 RepID=UPI0021F799A5|nr:hypothetical protein [Glutamicibacter sp. JL.03c]UYQ76700.1 hypothetical protein OF385_11765 [Glutamicibacter sp. JL.03c]